MLQRTGFSILQARCPEGCTLPTPLSIMLEVIPVAFFLLVLARMLHGPLVC